jgi:hypothetical protein
MAYPQPDSDQYAIQGVQYFRLLTELATPGDIYESQQSCHALAIGPESDVANVNLAYFDGQVPTFVALTQVGPPRSFTGRVDARNTDKYAPSGRPGRILFWPADLYDPTFIPEDFLDDQDTLTFITPKLDVIQYFKPQQSLVPLRNDKTFRFTEIDQPENRTAFLVLPFWGRKYAQCRVMNNSDQSLAWGVTGITYFSNDQNKAMETTIERVDAIAPGDQHTTLVRAASNGTFDALMFDLNISEGSGPTPFEVLMSDTPA